MGPYYKEGAPFRGRLMPQDAPGTPMLIRGHVYGHDTRNTAPRRDNRRLAGG